MSGNADGDPRTAKARLPNGEQAIVERRKVEEYLLNSAHPHGAGKAAFFRRFGFTSGRWGDLADALVEHAQNQPATLEHTGSYGEEWVVVGPLQCPDGRQPNVKSVWQVSPATGIPRLITAYRHRG